MTQLSVRGLTVLRDRRTALEDVSFSAAAGAVTAVLGAAGSGKTSLLAAVAGLLPVERGAVFVGNEEVTGRRPGRRGVGLLAPGTVLPAARSTAASLRLVAARGARDGVAELLERLGFGWGDVNPGRLSHGAGWLALGAARLLAAGEVLLVDEAGVGLDPEARARFVAALRAEAVAGRTVVLATREPAMARAADHLVLLQEGRVVQAGTPASLYAEPRDAVAARLTGEANIFSGRIREIRGAHFIWANGGRFVQAADPGMPRPALGAEVTLCLRPERMALLLPGDPCDNALEAEIADVRSAGALLDIWARTALGVVRVAAPSHGPRFYPAAGMAALVGWGAEAAWVLP
jgi:ABC-type Fe3+/spermidine/putrescine transport system ATPase subunit